MIMDNATTRQQRIAHEIYDAMDDRGNLQSGLRWTSNPRLHGICAAWEVARAVGAECEAELEAVCDAGGY